MRGFDSRPGLFTSMAKETIIIIIDGNALLHRAWHALPPLTTSSGEVVNAVYGFASILLKALKDLAPQYAVVAFDRKAPTFRHEQYAEYKATREKQPEELYQQLGYIKELLSGLGIPVFEKDGFEADDVIATICSMLSAERPDLEKVIVTGDMDLLQLIDEHTKVYTPKKGITDTILYDIKQVEERFDGLKPTQLVYYKALRGDASDNIPGVKGIGEKTAIQIVREAGDFDNLFQKIDDQETIAGVRGSIIEKLAAEKEHIFKTLTLVTLVRDVPVAFSLAESRLGAYKQEDLVRLFQKLEFRSLIPRLSDIPGFTATPTFFESQDEKKQRTDEPSYQLIAREDDARSCLADLAKDKLFAFDTETTSERPFEADLVGMSFSRKQKMAVYIPWSLPGRAWKEDLKRLLEREDIQKAGHNIKYDIEVMRGVGIEVGGVVFDSMLSAYVINPGVRDYSLDSLAFAEFGYQKIPITSLIGTGKDQKSMAEVPVNDVCTYACEDADFTLRLYEAHKERLKSDGLLELFDRFELPLVHVLADMEANGVLLDCEYLENHAKKVSDQLKKSQEKIYFLAGEEFNIASPTQLKKILFEKLEISTHRIRKGKTGLSTAASELEKMRSLHPIIECIVEHRELSKLLNTYILVLPTLVNRTSGRLHTSFNQTIAATGRLSSSNPNLQNIPVRQEIGRDIRKSFRADSGFVLLSADYSQIELRVVAALANDQKMLSAFKNNIDIHTATAAEINGVSIEQVTPAQRRAAKEVNFGVLYGMGPQGLSESTGISYGEAQSFIDQYFLSFPSVRMYLDDVILTAQKKGYVETLFGRRRYVPEINSNMPQVRNAAVRAAVNMPVQGTAADIMKLAMIRVWKELRRFKEEAKMILQVHDELLFEVREPLVGDVIPIIKHEMEHSAELLAPLVVDIKKGPNWGELQSIES